jgi:hypothetical protein
MSRWTSAVCIVFFASATPVDVTARHGDALTADHQSTPARKHPRTKAEERMESRLLQAIEREKRGEAVRAGDRLGLDVDEMGRVLLDVRADVTEALIHAIEEAGGIVVSRFPKYESVRARLRLSALATIAERDDVKFIRAADRAATNPPGR